MIFEKEWIMVRWDTPKSYNIISPLKTEMKVTAENSTYEYVGMWGGEWESCIYDSLFLCKVVEDDGEGGGRIAESGKGVKWHCVEV